MKKKISEDGSVTLIPSMEEINKFLFHFRARDPDTKEPSIFFGRSGRLYFRRCKGCGCLFPTNDKRQFYHNRECQTHPRSLNEPTGRVCRNCGRSLRKKRNDAQTCSNACRQASYRYVKDVLSTNFVYD